MAARRTRWMSLLFLVAAAYLGICVLLYFRQDAMVFFPVRATEAELAQLAKSEGFQPWRNPRGELIGWESSDGDSAESLLVLHGNGGFALHRSYLLPLLRSRGTRWKIFLLEYPGYGARPGSPSEPAFVSAGGEALEILSSRGAVRLFGESLGSGVASALAGRNPTAVAGVVLVTPFNSLTAAARSHYPWLPVGWLLRTRFDSEKHLAAFPGPVAFLLAEKDTIIPPRLGERLYETYPGRKRLWTIPGAGHNDSGLLLAEWDDVARWLEEAPPKSP